MAIANPKTATMESAMVALGRLVKSKYGQRRLCRLFPHGGFHRRVFDLAMAIRLKICMLVMDEPSRRLRATRGCPHRTRSHDKAATPTRKTSDIDHLSELAGKARTPLARSSNKRLRHLETKRETGALPASCTTSVVACVEFKV